MRPEYLVVATLVLLTLAYLYHRQHKDKQPAYYAPLMSWPAVPIPDERATNYNVALYGDSISAVSKLDVQLKRWVDASYQFFNRAIAGSCLTDLINPYMGLLALGDQIRSEVAGIVVNNYGRNDAFFNRMPAVFMLQLQTFVNAARESGKVPVLCSLTAEFYLNKDARERAIVFDTIIHDVALNMNVHYIDMHAVEASYNDTLDGVHPTTDLRQRYDEHIFQYLDSHVRGPLAA